MKKNVILIIISLFFLIGITSFISIMIYKNYNSKIDIQLVNESWGIYDENINGIKTNMDSITEPNENFDWWKLKDFDIEDDDYENTLNDLVSHIRTCYIEYTDNGEFYTNSNPIRKYRDKKYITKEELADLNLLTKNDNCITSFESLSGIHVSDNKELEDKFQKQIKSINLYSKSSLYRNDNATYNELLMRKINEVQLVKEISDFLVDEYSSLK